MTQKKPQRAPMYEQHPSELRQHCNATVKAKICVNKCIHFDAWLTLVASHDRVVMTVERRKAGRTLEHVAYLYWDDVLGCVSSHGRAPEGRDIFLGSRWLNRRDNTDYKAQALKLHAALVDNIDTHYRDVQGMLPPSVILHYMEDMRTYVDPWEGLGPNLWETGEGRTHSDRMREYHATKPRPEGRTKPIPGNQGGWKTGRSRLAPKLRSILRTYDKLLGLIDYEGKPTGLLERDYGLTKPDKP